jgi:DNA-binding transcriptional LysR family regulator
MNLRFLETFLMVARLKSFSAAGERMNTTQAAVSSRIATLERQLGVRLFERDMRSVVLTPHGLSALARAEEIVKLVAEFRTGIGSPATLSGTIAIGTVDTIVYTWLPRLLDQMKATYPHVSLDLTVDTSRNIAELVRDGGVDLGILMGPVMDETLQSIEVCSFECAWFASAKLGLPSRLELSDVILHPLFAYSKGSQPHQAILRLLEQHGVPANQARIYNSNSIATMIRLLCDSGGIAALPAPMVEDHPDAARIARIDVNVVLPPMRFHVVYGESAANPIPATIARMAQRIAAEFDAQRCAGP